MRRTRDKLRCCAIAALASCAGGCTVGELATSARMARGLVVVLPGIEGRSAYNVSIARGLDEGGAHCGIEIFEWNAPIPFMPLVNLAGLERNKRQAKRLADRIVEYQADYPGRPVHLVGHSGGGGLAVLALEALPADARIASAVLLAAAISPEHDLTPALRRTEYGIFNFHSERDVVFLSLGTGVAGTIDRKRGASAGAVGFEHPRDGSAADIYERKLWQIPWMKGMSASGNDGSHMGWTRREFVRSYLAPLVTQQQQGNWPNGIWRQMSEELKRTDSRVQNR